MECSKCGIWISSIMAAGFGSLCECCYESSDPSKKETGPSRLTPELKGLAETYSKGFKDGLLRSIAKVNYKIMNIDNTYLGPQHREKLAKALTETIEAENE